MKQAPYPMPEQTAESISFDSLARLTKSMSLADDRMRVLSLACLSVMGKLAATGVRFAIVNYAAGDDNPYRIQYYSSRGVVQKGLSEGVMAEDLVSLTQGKAHRLRSGLTALPISISETERLVLKVDLTKRQGGEDRSILNMQELRYLELMLTITVSAINNLEVKRLLIEQSFQSEKQNIQLKNLFNISKDFSSLVDSEQIVRVFSYYLMGHLQLTKYALLYDSEEGLKIITNKFSNIDNQDIENLYTQGNRQLVQQENEAKGNIRQNTNGVAVGVNAASPISLTVPAIVQGRSLGAVYLGKKLSGEPFTEYDKEYLGSLVLTAFTALENAALIDERIKLQLIEGELELAKSIQNRLFPKQLPNIDGYEVAAHNRPAKHVGGDYFDIIRDKNKNYAIVMADVSGKGVPASLIMANLQSAVRLLVGMGFRLETIVEELNTIVVENTSADKFVTLCLSLLKPNQALLKNCTAGHPPPIHFKKNAAGRYSATQFSLMERGGMVLGVIEGYKDYEAEYHSLESGDIIVYYTDGFTDGDLGGRSGFDVFVESVVSELNKNVQLDEVILSVIDCMSQIEGIIPDDMTLLILKKI